MPKDVREVMGEFKEEKSVFRLFDDGELDRLSPYFRVFEYPRGTIVMEPGEALETLGVLVSGEVLLEEEMDLKGNWTVLYDLKRGSILAHPSLFGSEPPPIRLTIREDTVFLGTDRDAFEAFLDAHPQMGITFLKEIIRVLFVRSRAMADRLTDVF
jgi:CRP-like cAMP-binding protein